MTSRHISRKKAVGGGGGGGVLPEKLDGGVRRTSENPYPISNVCDFLYSISDQNNNLKPCFRPDL